MKILNKMGLHHPSTSISNDDKVLQDKLNRNSKKILAVQNDLASGNGKISRLQKRLVKLQAKESFLIATKDLKLRFMIETPEDFNEHSDIKAEKHKIYKNIQNTVNELYSSLEEKMHLREGMTIEMASQSLGENLGIVKSILNMVDKELIPMAHDGVALKGYYSLKRDLQGLVENTMRSQKLLLETIGKESVVAGNIVNNSMFLTSDQLDALQMVCQSTQQRLTTMRGLLDISLNGGESFIQEDKTLTEQGIQLGVSLKNNLAGILNSVHLSNVRGAENTSIRETLPSLQFLNIGALMPLLQREGFDVAKAKIEEHLGALGEDTFSIVEENPAVDGDIDDGASTISTGRQSELSSIRKEVFCPFKNCETTEDVLVALEKMASITLEDGSPAIDILNVCNALVQSIKRDINLGSSSYTSISLFDVKHPVYYKVGERVDKQDSSVLRSFMSFSGERGNKVHSHSGYGRDKLHTVRDNYLMGVTTAIDSFSGLLQSVGSKEINIIIGSSPQAGGEYESVGQDVDNVKNEEGIYEQADNEFLNQQKIKKGAEQSISLSGRAIRTPKRAFVECIDKATQFLENGMQSDEIISDLGSPESNSLFTHFVASDSLTTALQENPKDILKSGYPIMLDWLLQLPVNIIPFTKKEQIVASSVVMTGNEIRKISPEIQKYVTGLAIEEDVVIDAPYKSKEECMKQKEAYRVKIASQPSFIQLAEEEKEQILDLLVLQGNLKFSWDRILQERMTYRGRGRIGSI